MQRDPDLLATVLKTEHVLDGAQSGQLAGVVGPGVHDGPGPCRRQGREAASWSAGEADDLAAARRRSLREQWVDAGTGGGGLGPECRKAVLEDNHVIVVGRDLGGHRAAAGRAKRALVRRWQERAVLAVAGNGDPVAGQCVQTHRPGRSANTQRTLVGHVAALGPTSIGLGVVEVDELAAVGQRGAGASNPREGSGVLGHEL